MVPEVKPKPLASETTMKSKAINVRKTKGSAPVKVNLQVGESVVDPFWQEVGLSQADLNDKAIQSHVIDFQGSARRNWERFKANPQAYADAYTAGRKASVVALSKQAQQEQGFSASQLAYLASIGVSVEQAAAAKSKK